MFFFPQFFYLYHFPTDILLVIVQHPTAFLSSFIMFFTQMQKNRERKNGFIKITNMFFTPVFFHIIFHVMFWQ